MKCICTKTNNNSHLTYLDWFQDEKHKNCKFFYDKCDSVMILTYSLDEDKVLSYYMFHIQLIKIHKSIDSKNNIYTRDKIISSFYNFDFDHLSFEEQQKFMIKFADNMEFV